MRRMYGKMYAIPLGEKLKR